MAYIAPVIKDRIATGDNIYLMENLGGGLVRFTPQPASVTEAGTDIGKGILQPAFDAIAAHDIAINDTIPANIANAISGNEHGWGTYSFTSASFSNCQYSIAIPYKRFILYPQVGLVMDTTYTSFYVDGYDQYFICDRNTQLMLGWYDFNNGNSTAADGHGLIHAASRVVASAIAKTNSDDIEVMVTLTSTGLLISREGKAPVSSISGTMKILQI